MPAPHPDPARATAATKHRHKANPPRANPPPQSDTYTDTVLKLIDDFTFGIAACDTNSDHEFSSYIRAATNFFPLNMSQRAIATRLCITPMTLQRWAAGSNLPYPVPRKAYFRELLDLLQEVRDAVAGEDADGRGGAQIIPLVPG